MEKNDRNAYIVNQLWSVILPGYEDGLDGIMFALNKCKRLNITKSEVIDTINKDLGLSFFEDIRANIGDNVYHVTLAGNLPEIVETGLKPKVCDESDTSNKPSIPTVFMAKSPSYGSCICGSAKEKSGQAIIELDFEQIEIFRVNSFGHKISEYDPHKVAQLGSHKHIPSVVIKTVYINSNAPNSNLPVLERVVAERGIPLIAIDVSLPPKVQVNKNTWTRVIAEYRGRNLPVASGTNKPYI